MDILLPTSYFPPVSYCSLALSAERIIIEQEESYPKQTPRNHCLILGPNGIQKLTVPVIRVNGNHTKTKEIRVDTSVLWQRQHLRSIETAYNNSPFYLYYCDEVRKILQKDYQYLIDLNLEILQMIMRIMRKKAEIVFNEEFGNDGSLVSFSRKNSVDTSTFPEYMQVFSDRSSFIPDLSILDLLFNLGPEAGRYLSRE